MRNQRYWTLLPLTLSLFLAAASHPAEAEQVSSDIALDPPIECWYHSQFPTLGADVVPFEDVVRARLYFRCSLYPDYYFVDLSVENGSFHGVAPQAEVSCPSVHYYVEAVSSDFSSSRTEERIADVTDENECRRRFPAAAWFTGDDPGILLGSTVAGPSLAPGFKSLGVAGFISSSGAATAVAAAEGGLSGAALGGIVAAGAGAAGAGVLASGGSSDSSTTTSVVASGPPTSTTTTTVAPTTTAPSGAVSACFTLDPPTGVVQAREPLTIDGRCSTGPALQFRYDLGDGRIKEGQPFITAIWTNPGTYTLRLTVTGGTTLAQETDTISREIVVERPPDPVRADFVARGIGQETCIGLFDGSPSTGDIVEYLWELDVDGRFGPVVGASGQVVQHDWGTSCFRAEGMSRARLTVVGADGSTSSIVKSFSLFGLRATEAVRPLEVDLFTEILEGDAGGQLVLPSGGGERVTPGAPVHARFEARAGTNAVEAVLQSASSTPVLWRFDFSRSRRLAPGSLRVVSGQEVARDAYSVVLRFSGAAGERARIELRLED